MCSDYSIASDESTVSDFSLRSDDRGSLDVSGIKDNSALGYPDILSPLFIDLGIERGADLKDKFLYQRKNFPGILLSFKERSYYDLS